MRERVAQRNCKMCGAPFRPRGRQLTCSDDCSKENERRNNADYNKKYNALHPGWKAEYRKRAPKRVRPYCKRNIQKERQDKRNYYARHRDTMIENARLYKESHHSQVLERAALYACLGTAKNVDLTTRKILALRRAVNHGLSVDLITEIEKGNTHEAYC